MKVSNQAVTAKLEEITRGYAVIYLDIMPGQPISTAAAGRHKGQTYYLNGIIPHEIPEDLDVKINANSVEFRDADGTMTHYLTPATEAPEIEEELVATQVKAIRRMIKAEGGILEILPK